MAVLHLDALPPRTTKGSLVRLVIQVGKLDRQKIGKIELSGRSASVEVPDRWVVRLVKSLDGVTLGHHLIRAWHEEPAEGGSVQDHFSRLLGLLDIEADAQAQQAVRQRQALSGKEAELTGHCLIDLVIREEAGGLGGRCLVTLSKSDAARPLPWTRLSVGNPVVLSLQSSSEGGWRGVISSRGDRSIEVALAQSPPVSQSSDRFRLDLSSDEVAGQRQRAALQRARAARGDRLAVLRRVLLGEQPAGLRDQTHWEPCNPHLNRSQVAAIQLALAAEDVAIIHGPPGTGKTTTVIELIRQAVRRGESVLACAPSNLAVDNLFERLLNAGEAALRLGHPARVLPELRRQTLDLMVEEHADFKLAKKLRREGFAMLDKAGRFTRAKPLPGAKREMRDEAKKLLEDARRIEAQVVQQVLDAADILCATLTGIDSDVLGKREFDLVVIDEACQTTEPACWIPLLRSHRVVLAGDHFQLPPTVVSDAASRQGFGVSLLERLVEQGCSHVCRQLTVQYRMHQEIMEFPSAEFYDGSLIADDAVRQHRLCELADVSVNAVTQFPLMFIDTAGAGFDEQLEADGQSRFNPREAELVVARVKAIMDSGLDASLLAIITPYAAQVRHLRERLADARLEIDTVDGFQGREKEAIILSLVRSNPAGDIGFLNDTRRTNVALTRARRQLIVIGDSATVASHPFYCRLLEYLELCGAYRTVWEFADPDTEAK